MIRAQSILNGLLTRRKPGTSALLLAAMMASTGCVVAQDETGIGAFAAAREHAERQANEQYLRTENELVACVSKEGFEYEDIYQLIEPDELDDDSHAFDTFMEEELAGLNERELIEVTGFGFAPESLRLRDIDIPIADSPNEPQDDESQTLETDLKMVFERCSESTGFDQPADSVIAFSELATQVEERTISDPSFTELLEDWSKCMSNNGYGAASIEQLIGATEVAYNAMQELDPLLVEVASVGNNPDESFDPTELAGTLYGSASSWEELAFLEIAVATAELDCRELIGFATREAAIRDRIGDDLVPSG